MRLEMFQKKVFQMCLCLLLLAVGLMPAGGAAPLQAAAGPSEDLLSVSFASEMQGWACGRGGSMFHTTDGGRTWNAQASGTSCTLASVCFVDPLSGWAVGDEGTIIHTEDGGKTWMPQQSPARFYLMKVQFLNSLQGYIVTEHTYIFYTDDGGVTWGTMFSDGDFILKSVSFCDPLHGWAVGEYGFIYHTSTGGAVWEKQAGEYGFSQETGDVVGGTFLFDVKAIDPDNAWAVGIDGQVIRTRDGGRTWERIVLPGRKTQFFCLALGRDGSVVIGGNGVVLLSTDGGRNWTRPDFEPPATYGWFYGLAARDSCGFVAVGWEGSVYKSFGSMGKRWEQAGR